MRQSEELGELDPVCGAAADARVVVAELGGRVVVDAETDTQNAATPACRGGSEAVGRVVIVFVARAVAVQVGVENDTKLLLMLQLDRNGRKA